MSWDEPCGNRHDDVTAIRCERLKGHPGDHEGYFTELVTWERYEEEGSQANTEVTR